MGVFFLFVSIPDKKGGTGGVKGEFKRLCFPFFGAGGLFSWVQEKPDPLCF